MTRLDLIILAVPSVPGFVSWAMARAWIALGNPLWPAISPSLAPWIAARLAIGAVGLVAGLVLLGMAAHSIHRSWRRPWDAP